MVQLVLRVLVVLFPVSEIALAFLKRSRGRAAQSEDRGSMRLIWIGISLGFGLAIAAQSLRPTRLPGSPEVLHLVALALLVVGLAVRWVAIVTLGRFFTVDIAIHPDHTVIHTGLYRYVRHPSYTGLLLAFLGIGVLFGNWLSILGLLVPSSIVIFNRVVKEEHSLAASLGPEYTAYCARTKRFIPGLL
jgi:protein-S-isoprenylcysteine O-methyltransferase